MDDGALRAFRRSALLGLTVIVTLLTGSGADAQASRPAQVAAPPAPVPAAAGPRLPISLADAVFIGLRDNRTVKSAYLSRAAEKYDLFVARTRFLPSGVIDASVDRTRQKIGRAHV